MWDRDLKKVVSTPKTEYSNRQWLLANLTYFLIISHICICINVLMEKILLYSFSSQGWVVPQYPFSQLIFIKEPTIICLQMFQMIDQA